MRSKKLAALVAVSLVSASSAAVAQNASPLSLTNSPALRAGATTGEAGQLDTRNGIGIYVIAAILIGLVAWGSYELFFKKDHPHSP
jgi:hypothetical protein